VSVGIQTDPIERNERLWSLGLDAYQTTSGEAVGATWDDAWARNPTPSIGRAMDRQGYYPSTDEFGIESGPRKDATILDAKRANEEYGIAGELSFGQDVPEPIAEELHRLKRDELMRRDVLKRSPGGFMQGAASLGTGFLASALDPINIASAFIPVVGPARYGLWVAERGPTVARLAKGGIEGAVGSTLVEPIVYGVARSEQADYHATDSLLNIAFGTALGGGLHAGLGKIGDLIAQRHAQEPTLRAAVAAITEGRPVDVESGLRADLLGSVYSRGLDDLLPPELRAARDLQAREVQGPPEAAGPPVDGFALTRQVENVRGQRDAAQAELERLTAERDKAANLAKDVTEAETARLTSALTEVETNRRALREELAQAQAEVKAATPEVERAEGRLGVQVGSGIEGPKLAKAERQAKAARDKLTAAEAKVEAAKARLKEAEARKAEIKTQAENYKANREKVVQSTLGPIEARLAAAKQASDLEAKNLAAAEKALGDYTSGRLAALQESMAAQAARAREEFMNRAVQIGRQSYVPHPEDARASVEIEAIAERAVDADPAKALPQMEAEIVDLTARLKAMGSTADIGDDLTKNADATAKAYEQAAVCEYMKVAAE
jgi:hypothetical protein